MKKVSSLTLLALFISFGLAAQYCTPPDFTSGPFTGILHVKFAGIDNRSSGSDGYEDFTSGNSATVSRGENITVDVEVEHTLLNGAFSDKVDLRIWIDWNQDFDFDDPGEEVVKHDVDCSVSSGQYNTAVYSTTITVPADAKLGSTRMRVYEDMLVQDGHEPATPCGYSSGIGQHGEAEDYTVNVESASAVVSIEKNNVVKVFPNPANSVLNLTMHDLNTEVVISVINTLGEEIASPADQKLQSGQVQLSVSELPEGLYYARIITSGSQQIVPFVIRH